MSNELAIAAVTITLRNLLDGVQELKNNPAIYDNLPEDLKIKSKIEVSNLPLDAAFDKSNKDKNYLNLFLYHVEHSAAWRNRDIPRKVKPGETGSPPLALNLYYIITAYGENGSELIGHMLLGKAMSILHDHPVLGREEIKIALDLSELHKQVERLRITPQPISLDEVSKLWTGFQTQYRLSAAYEVSVALIESRRSARTPLPVLTRGGKDEKGNEKGVFVYPNLIPPFPTLEDVTFSNKQTGALPGDQFTLTGHHLGIETDTVIVRFAHPLLVTPNEITVLPGDRSETRITVQLPDDPPNWPAGFYRIAVLVKTIIDTKEYTHTTNEIPLMMMPFVKTIAIDSVNIEATVTCSPQVWPDQEASLLLGDREFKADSHPSKTDTLKCSLDADDDKNCDVPPGKYYVRLRVNGVDSPLIDYSKEPPEFYTGPNYEVTIP